MKNKTANKAWILTMFLLVLIFSSCEKNENPTSYSPPADHTKSKDGVMHKNGLDDPLTNCASCHGSDLTGGNTGLSCFECHGKKW